MSNLKLHLYSIMPLDLKHVDEICEDIRFQYESGTASCPLFNMTLVPEGNPPVDKVGALCAKYKVFKEKLDAMGIPSGVLVQATIGHGWVLGDLFPYQRYTNLNDGAQPIVVCPSDTGFHDYLFHIFRTITEQHPDCIMLDDDFRLIGRSGRGCACPHHLARFNELAGTDITREELWNAIRSGNEKYLDIFVETQKESLLEAAKIMRAGIDSVDPKMPGSFCCVSNNAEFAADIAKIMAGKGNPVVVRINNGNYTAEGARYFSRAFGRAAAQIAKLKHEVDVILAETDTCPQNRYSTGAMQLHTHFTGTLIEGAAGAKHWITRLAAHEPSSGKAYRKILGKHRGFYEAIAALAPTLKHRGCRIPVSDTPNFSPVSNEWNTSGWVQCVLERLGLPVYFGAEPDGIACLHGDDDCSMNHEKIMAILSGPVFLASDTAKHLIDRGYGEYLGIDVRKWEGATPTTELLSVNGNHCKVQVGTRELVKLSDTVVEDSAVYNSVDKENYTYLFPGTTVYKNKLGGTVVSFSGTPQAKYNLVEAFSFLNESRKLQLIRLMKQVGELPVYYPNDEEVYLRAADMTDGGLFTVVFNIGLDPIDELELICERDVKRIEKLMPDGSRCEVSFTRDGEHLTLDCACLTLDPVILFLY